MKTSIILLASILLCTGCVKTSDPSPASNLAAGSGSWSYGGNTFTVTAASWVSSTLVASANKVHSSALEASFNSATPATGDYTISTNGQVNSGNQVIISVVDSTLPAITYESVNASGTVSVTRSGSSTTITVTNLKLLGITSKLVADSIYVTGTITKK